MSSLLTLTKRSRSKTLLGVLFKCQPCLAFLALCVAGVGLIVWTQAFVLYPRLMTRLDTPRGSAAGTPCLLSSLYNINCSQLTSANVTYVQEMAARKQWKSSGRCRQEPLQTLVQDCQALKEQHGYYRWPVTAQEENFPLAFGLKVHHAPEMLERMLRVLWRPHNLYCIHVDNKTSPHVYEVIKNLTDCFDNVVMAKVRVDLIYLSIGSLLSDIECMRVALKSTIPWRYYLNLSGQEFPLKTNLELVQILTLLNGKNDVESYLPTRYVSSWFAFKYTIINGSLYPTQQRKEPFNYPIQIRKGSAYGTFSHAFLDYALNSKLARDFMYWLIDTMAPDELFWATLNHVPGAPGAVFHPVSHRYNTVLSRAVVWEWDKYKCRNYVRGVCIFTSPDLPWLVSRPELIANKFFEQADPIVLDCLEITLEQRTMQAYKEAISSPLDTPVPVKSLNWTYYNSLPHLVSS